MPDPTDRQLAADALHQAFLVNLIAEEEALAYQDRSDSDDGSDKNMYNYCYICTDPILDRFTQLFYVGFSPF